MRVLSRFVLAIGFAALLVTLASLGTNAVVKAQGGEDEGWCAPEYSNCDEDTGVGVGGGGGGGGGGGICRGCLYNGACYDVGACVSAGCQEGFAQRCIRQGEWDGCGYC